MFSKKIWIKAGLAWNGHDWLQPKLRGQLRVMPDLEKIPQEGLRQKKMMSHSAWLSYLALHWTLQSCDWFEHRDEIACFLGVGASGSEEAELNRIIGASLNSQGEFSINQFGTAGLAACNPLFAFQLMNNFTLCHGSILEKLGGPNSAFYSRGVGTVVALAEACFALEENQTDRALAGGADTSFHPVTQVELLRAGRISEGLKLAEGAAYLALTCDPSDASEFYIDRVEFFGGGGGNWKKANEENSKIFTNFVEKALSSARVQDSDTVFIMPWGIEVRKILGQKKGFKIIEDLSETLGESLAASPAVAWVEGLRRMIAQDISRGIVLSAGIDGGLGAVTISRGKHS